MTEILSKTALIMLVLVAEAAGGFLLRKTKLVSSESLLSLANILLYFCQPMLSIKAFAVDPVPPTGETLLRFLTVALLAVPAVLLSFGASKLVFHFPKRERGEKDVLVFIGTFSNCTFLGIPFVDLFTGGDSEAMMYMIVFGAVFNVLLWTLGAYLITQDRKQISVRRALLNPSTIGSAVGLLFFLVPQINFFNMDAVSELRQIVVYTGNMTAPLSMIIVGVRAAELSPRELFADRGIWLAALCRLVLSFGLTYLMVLPFKLTGMFAENPYVLYAPVIAMSMPPASTIVAFAERYGKGQRLAAAAFSTVTLLSAATLPFALTLLML